MPLAPERSIKDVVTDFLSAAPTLLEIAAYRLPDDLQVRDMNCWKRIEPGVYSLKNG